MREKERQWDGRAGGSRGTSNKYDFDDDRPGLTAFRRRVNPFISVAPFYIPRPRQFPPVSPGLLLPPSFSRVPRPSPCPIPSPPTLSFHRSFPLARGFSHHSRSSTSVCRFVSLPPAVPFTSTVPPITKILLERAESVILIQKRPGITSFAYLLFSSPPTGDFTLRPGRPGGYSKFVDGNFVNDASR